MSILPPDPWRVLGIERSADKTEIRKAYRKLVLSCHPDKVQDEALKALKQDEFQKVQQAYELLNDDTELAKYEERVKLQELKRQAEQQAALRSKNMPNISASRTPPRSASKNYFEIRVAEPRSRPSETYPVSATKIYTSSGRTKSYETVEEYRSSDDEYRRARREREREREREPSSGKSLRREEEVRESRRRDKDDRRKEEDLVEERRRDKEAKELRDRERRQRDERRSREKRSATEEKSRKKGPSPPYVEEYRGDEDVYAAAAQLKAERKKLSSSSSSKKLDEIREKSSSRRERAESPRAVVDIEAKTDRLREAAATYIERHRSSRPAVPPPPKAPMLGRSATMPTQHYMPPAPHVEDMDEPRRSSARTTTRRPSDPQELHRRSKDGLYKTSQRSNEKIDVRPASPPPSKERGAPPPPLRAHTMPVIAEPEPSSLYRDRDMSSRRTPQVVKPPRLPIKTQTWSPGTGDPRAPVFSEYVVEEERLAEPPRRHRSARHEVVEDPYVRLPMRRETSYKVSADRKSTSKVDVYEDSPYGYDDRRGPPRRATSYAVYDEPSYLETGRGQEYFYQESPELGGYKVKTSKPVLPEDVQYAPYYPQPGRPIYSQS